MSFSLGDGTHIGGGTFNNVAGNMTMTQVIHSMPAVSKARRVDEASLQWFEQIERQDTEASNPMSIQDSFLLRPVREPAGDGSTSIFNSVNGDLTHISVTSSQGESAFDILRRHVVMEALHDSGERFPEPACHPGTRTAVLEQLRSWSSDTDQESALLWLHGSAGIGKSAIAQMFAGDCQRRGQLAASFFFRRGHEKRGTWKGLFTTIAYQLATSFPAFHVPVQKAVENDKLVVGRAMAAQFQKLILDPFLDFLRTPGRPAAETFPVIILDGLDECADHKVQQQILRFFICSIRDHHLPLRLLTTSRPEPHIREILEAEDTLSICHHSILQADQSAYNDIRTYLCDEFSRINSEYKDRGVDLGAVWPASDALEHLVAKSSAIFVYATTVIRFVDDEYSHPIDKLEALLKLDPTSTAPLDDLYAEILSVIPQDARALRILHSIWQGQRMTPEQIDMLWMLRPGTCRLALRGLHSLVYVPPPCTQFMAWDGVEVLHASFRDYLCDERRSQGCLLRNENFQDNIFLADEVDEPGWPGRDSVFPPDLIQLWQDHQWISNFEWDLRSLPNRTSESPEVEFDSIYQEIFSRSTDLLVVMRSKITQPPGGASWIELLGPRHTARIFQPFLDAREHLHLPLVGGRTCFPQGDSPVDFLMNPVRAGNLHCDPADIAEDLVLIWIEQAKEFIAGNGVWLST
ncbi:putative nwd2 protein [Mycena venus]|uniref:Putative nwd2 protein n=1 Tax=Mycena venus TaxID=2733690 RepID=A0A8H6YEJ4_9AGAR|nr:putative nwd2 protein [Mycena venus]